jgi:hypothetical protein
MIVLADAHPSDESKQIGNGSWRRWLPVWLPRSRAVTVRGPWPSDLGLCGAASVSRTLDLRITRPPWQSSNNFRVERGSTGCGPRVVALPQVRPVLGYPVGLATRQRPASLDGCRKGRSPPEPSVGRGSCRPSGPYRRVPGAGRSPSSGQRWARREVLWMEAARRLAQPAAVG